MRKDDRLLRIGVLGCGPIAQFAHFDACRKAHNAELYAMCDTASDLLAQMAAVHHPRVTYGTYDAMLADPQVEAVIIATADQFHVPLARKAIAAGKHVLVEKPLGVDLDDCEALRAELRDTRLVFQVANNKRFDPGIAFAQQFMAEDMGELLALKAWYCDSTYRYAMTDNLQPIPEKSSHATRPPGDPKADKERYFLLTHGSHLVDTARYLGGEILAVSARLALKSGAYCWFIDVDYRNGALGHLDLTIPIRGDFSEGFRAYGELGSVAGTTYLPWFHKASDVECFSAKDGQFHRPLGEDAYTYKLQIEGFADAILQGADQRGATVDDGVAAMQALVAIRQSVRSGKTVSLADVGGSV